MPDKDQGFTLVELLIAVLVLTISAACVTAGFIEIADNTRYSAYVDEMQSALHLTRSEAVYRNKTISLCGGVEDCRTKRWENQLIVFIDKNQNGQFDNEEAILRTLQITPPFFWNWSNFRSKNYVSFTANGMTHSLNGTLTLCRGPVAVRSIVINITGRARRDKPKDDSRCK